MKYREGSLKITGQNLYQAKACPEGLDQFVKKFEFYQPAIVNSVVIWAKKHKGYIEWLIENDFLEEDGPKRHSGQRYVNGDEKYLLARVDKDRVSLVGLEDGNRCDNPLHCEDSNNISNEEWGKITDRQVEDFKLVK